MKNRKPKKERNHSLALASSTIDLIEEAFGGKICEKCGKEPATRFQNQTLLCLKCAQPSNEKQTSDFVKPVVPRIWVRGARWDPGDR